MAEKQPMLSFAKVVSGQAEHGSPTIQKPQISSSSSSTHNENGLTIEQSSQNHPKREKENAGVRQSDRPPRGDGKGKRRNNRRDRKPKGEAKIEKPVEKAPVEEVKPVEAPVVLEPAPLPTINAWFKNNEEAAAAQAEQTTPSIEQTAQAPAPIAQKTTAPVPEKKKAVEPSTKPLPVVKEKQKSREPRREPWKSNTVPAGASPIAETTSVAATQEWPSLAKAELNGHVSSSNSDDNHESSSNSQHKTGGKTTKNSWKKVEISVDYGSKGKGAPRGNGSEKGTRRAANDEAVRRRSGEEDSASGDDQSNWSRNKDNKSPVNEMSNDRVVDSGSNGIYYQQGGTHGWKKKVNQKADLPTPPNSTSPQQSEENTPEHKEKNSTMNGNARNTQSASRNGNSTNASKNGDYWHKTNGKEDKSQQKAYYQRNDRYQARGGNNPHAPPKMTAAQRKERGPLPRWEDIEAGDDNFDYMTLMEAQYSQYYGAPQQFEHQLDPQQASILMQQARQHMASFSSFRPPMPMVSLHLMSPPLDREVTSPMADGESINTTIPFAPIFHQPAPPRPVTDETLKEYVRKQVEYYFSDDNLQKDFFLRRKMSPEGYLPVALIASFPRVRALTEDLLLIGEALQDSTKVELSSDNTQIRALENPTAWPLMPTVSGTAESIPGPSSLPSVPKQQNGVSETSTASLQKSSTSSSKSAENTQDDWKEVKSRKNNNAPPSLVAPPT